MDRWIEVHLIDLLRETRDEPEDFAPHPQSPRCLCLWSHRIKSQKHDLGGMVAESMFPSRCGIDWCVHQRINHSNTLKLCMVHSCRDVV